MSTVFMHMSVSLDGFSAGPDVTNDHPMGIGGERLHHWLFAAGDAADPVDVAYTQELRARLGATVIGRRTYDVGVDLWGDVPFPGPCLVVTNRRQAERPMSSGTFTFVDDIATAVAQARNAAGVKDVLVMGGAQIVQAALAAGLIDELNLQLVPVLLGGGSRVLDGLARTELIRTAVRPSQHVTHLRFEVARR